MAGVNLSWNLGSMYFARGEDAGTYQGMHVALTGARGALIPLAGWMIYSAFGVRAVFGLSTALFITAGALMLRQDRELGRALGARAARETTLACP